MTLDFDLMYEYVKNILETNNAIKPHNKNHQFRDRFMHTKRVVEWSKRLMGDYDDLDRNIIITSCIFHDSGYAFDKENHAEYSKKIFLEYAKNNNFDADFIEEVSWIIYNHSDKSLLKKTDNHNFIIVLEADLLDEEGAMGIMWDLLAAGKKDVSSYNDALSELEKHSCHILNQDLMISKTAKHYWNAKKKMVSNFMEQIKEDLFLEEI